MSTREDDDTTRVREAYGTIFVATRFGILVLWPHQICPVVGGEMVSVENVGGRLVFVFFFRSAESKMLNELRHWDGSVCAHLDLETADA